MAPGHFEDPDFNPGFALDLAPGQKHLLTLAVFADNVDAPMRQLAAEITSTGKITTSQNPARS